MNSYHRSSPHKDSQQSRASRNKESPKMGRQRKNMQSKGVEGSPVKKLNEMEASKLSDIEFKRMIIRMLKELADNYKELSENYNSVKKEIELINKNQEEMNNRISKIKNKLEGITSRLDKAEDLISELEDNIEIPW